MGGRRRKNLFKSASEQRTREFRKKSPNDTPINFFDNWMMELHSNILKAPNKFSLKQIMRC